MNHDTTPDQRNGPGHHDAPQPTQQQLPDGSMPVNGAQGSDERLRRQRELAQALWGTPATGGHLPPAGPAVAQPGAATPAARAAKRRRYGLAWLDRDQDREDAYLAARAAAAESAEEASQLLDVQPLVPKVDPEEFPLDALPEPVRLAVQEVIEDTQAPPAMVATCALTAMSAAVQGLVDVRRTPTLVGPVSIYSLVLADSGERKTTVDERFTRGLRNWQRRQEDSAVSVLKEQAAKVDAWSAIEAGYKERLKKAAKEGDSAEMARVSETLGRHALLRPAPIAVPSLLREDDTPEALFAHLQRWPLAAIMSSEAGTFFGGHGLRAESEKNALAQLNKAWGGEDMRRGRKGDGDQSVSNPRVTLGLQVQPDVYGSFMEKSIAREIGFTARFLITYPESTMGSRYFKQPAGGSPHTDAFNARCDSLLDEMLRSGREAGGLPTRAVVDLDRDPKVKATWAAYYDEIEEELGPEGRYRNVSGAAAKSPEYAARIYALFLLYLGLSQHSQAAMEDARDIARYYLNEERRMQMTVALPDGLRKAAMMELWLVDECIKRKTTAIPTRDVSISGPNSLRDIRVRDNAFELLESHNRAFRIEVGGRKAPGGKTPAQTKKFICVRAEVIAQWMTNRE